MPCCRKGRSPRNFLSSRSGVSFYFAGSAFQILISSKYPSLPETPSSILDLVGCATPGDFRTATGLPSSTARMVSPTVSQTSVYHLPVFEFHGKGGAAADQELGTFVFPGRILAHLVNVVTHRTFAVVAQAYVFQRDDHSTDVTIVGTAVPAIVKFGVNVRGAFEAELEFDNAIFRRNFGTDDGGMADHGRLTVGGGGVHTSLHSFQRAILESEGWDDRAPGFAELGAFKVIREKEFLSFGNCLIGDNWRNGSVCRKSGGGEEKGEDQD